MSNTAGAHDPSGPSGHLPSFAGEDAAFDQPFFFFHSS